MKKANLIGQKFHRLTVMSEHKKLDRKDTRAYWNCKCECGKIIIVPTNRLNRGTTRSCGCLRIEKSKENIKKGIDVCRKYTPRIASARRVWKSYIYQDDQCNLTFKQWFNMSQENCSYCDVEPYNTYNYFLKKKGASDKAKRDGDFSYNGLDRIDSTKFHTLDNVAPCCWVCNRAKNDLSTEKFYQYINNLIINPVFIQPEKLLELPQSYLLSSIKRAYGYYECNYGHIEVDLQTFYTFTQLSCFYCNLEKSNHCNQYLNDKRISQNAKDCAHFYYNGIDRLDNTKTHTIDNIVPCCYYCNFTKYGLPLSEFNDWIKRIKTFQENKQY
jgi:hypothetical protein